MKKLALLLVLAAMPAVGQHQMWYGMYTFEGQIYYNGPWSNPVICNDSQDTLPRGAVWFGCKQR